ncbi:hypothetical protein Sliba_00170 [Streptomyces nigrescens]|uniref:Uncharacterized protein n=1 Tax=Streptomyces nigrescens TaxID=1920 RepID=A0A640T8P9_STRNI|nr:hypothetical protein Sliba_00170 [Streptomyces libani subsp. libani]GGW04673.1 hypothetical protein GCM10010500_67250 [Streptomyces libani subsp. libani]
MTPLLWILAKRGMRANDAMRGCGKQPLRDLSRAALGRCAGDRKERRHEAEGDAAKAGDGGGGVAVAGHDLVAGGPPGSGGTGASLHQRRRRGDDAGPVRGAEVAVADLDARVGVHEVGVAPADLAGMADSGGRRGDGGRAAAWAPWARGRAGAPVTATAGRARKAMVRITFDS